MRSTLRADETEPCHEATDACSVEAIDRDGTENVTNEARAIFAKPN